MNFNNFTIKSQEAVQQAQILAQSLGHQQIENEHLYKGIEDELFKEVYFFREFSSEAVKILLPIQQVNTEAEINMFKASIELGLRKYYNGNPSHLHLLDYSEYNVTTGKFDQYLLLLDNIPGGTGYLSELFEWKNFKLVLSSALKEISDCSCQYRNLKGCYNCIYTYSNQYNREDLDREIIEDRLRRILELSHSVKSSKSGLNETNNKGRIEESELETRFVRLLQLYANQNENYEFEEINEYGVINYILRYTSDNLTYSYKLKPQVSLGQRDGIEYYTRADFVFSCLNRSVNQKTVDTLHFPKIAIYLDGYQYHASKNNYNFKKDFKIRESIRQSQEVISWTLTWKDLDLFEATITNESGGDSNAKDELLQLLMKDGYNDVKNHLLNNSPTERHTFFTAENNVVRLLKVLELIENDQTKLLSHLSLFLGCFHKKFLTPSYSPDSIEDAFSSETIDTYCFKNKTLDGLIPIKLDDIIIKGEISVLTNLAKHQGFSQFKPRWNEEGEDQQEWMNFWRLYNLTQFYEEYKIDVSQKSNFEELLELYDEPYLSILKKMIEKELIKTSEDEDQLESLVNDKGNVLATAVLVIHKQKIAISPLSNLDEKQFKKAGFTIILGEQLEDFEL